MPLAWDKKSRNLMWYKEYGHGEGDILQRWRSPKLFLEDMESFVKQVWK